MIEYTPGLNHKVVAVEVVFLNTAKINAVIFNHKKKGAHPVHFLVNGGEMIIFFA